MELQIQSALLEDYVEEIPGIIDFSSPFIYENRIEIEKRTSDPIKKAELAFLFVRDTIQHSFDKKSDMITISAEDAIKNKEGICFAKSHALAALLRSMLIPAGFCYQKVLIGDTTESGYALHGFNALYLDAYGWFRIDPRGNKPGVASAFSVTEEKLAYPIRKKLGEIDYPQVYVNPLPSVLAAMKNASDCHALFYERPKTIDA